MKSSVAAGFFAGGSGQKMTFGLQLEPPAVTAKKCV
jgi:hypothetical protein